MLTFVCGRNKLLVFLVSLLCVFVALIFILHAASSVTCAAQSEAKRTEYVKTLGFGDVCTLLEEKTVLIPGEFSQVYTEYNELQKTAGFDLSDYKGREVVQYTYSLDGTEPRLYAHILVNKGKIIGGDICDVALDGQMLPLIRRTDDNKT